MNTTANFASQPAELQAPTILITGATGSIGTELLKLLAEQGARFRAMVRSPKDVQTLSTLPGADVVLGDFNDKTTLGKALKGTERAFLLTNSSEQAESQQLSFVSEAKQAGVKHIVKVSQLAADVHSPVRFLRYHAVVEQTIGESGMAFTFLRPNLFMQGLMGFRSSIVEQGKFFAAVGDARISIVDIRDIASVAAVALTKPGHEGKIYTLTGPQALTHKEMANELSRALGRSVMFVDVPPAGMRAALAGAGFSDWQADGLIEDYAHYSRNEASAIETGIEEATGKIARNFSDFARDFATAFS